MILVDQEDLKRQGGGEGGLGFGLGFAEDNYAEGRYLWEA